MQQLGPPHPIERKPDRPRNQLVEVPEPGILFTRDNAAWAYHALKAVREAGRSIPEQDELCDELRRILFGEQATP